MFNFKLSLQRPLPCVLSRSVACKSSSHESAQSVSRRETLSTAAAAASVVFVSTSTTAKPVLGAPIPTSSASPPPKGRTLIVDPRGGFPPEEKNDNISFFLTVEAAVAEAREGDVVALSPDVEEHSGRAVLSVPGVTITTLGYDFNETEENESKEQPPAPEGVAAAAGPPPERTKRATLRHETPRPYESTVAISAPRCRVIGLDVRHSSKSVANNYAVFVQEAANDSDSFAAFIADCDVRSDSGAAVGIESPTRILRCLLRSRSRFGAAVFAPGPPATSISRCVVVAGGGGGSGSGKGSGSLLVRNAEVDVDGSVFRGGDLVLADGSGEFRRCALENGAKIERGLSWEGKVEEFL